MESWKAKMAGGNRPPGAAEQQGAEHGEVVVAAASSAPGTHVPTVATGPTPARPMTLI